MHIDSVALENIMYHQFLNFFFSMCSNRFHFLSISFSPNLLDFILVY